jgi:hypothetical protein
MKINSEKHNSKINCVYVHLCGLVVRVPGYRSRGPGLISGATKFSEKWVWNGVHLSTIEELLGRKCAALD